MTDRKKVTAEQFRGRLTQANIDSLFEGSRFADNTVGICTDFFVHGMTLTVVAYRYDTSRQNVYQRVTTAMRRARQQQPAWLSGSEAVRNVKEAA